MAKSKRSGSATPTSSKGASSSNPDRVVTKKTQKSGGTTRDKATINRLNLYKNCSVKRNQKGEVVGGDLADRDKAGGKEITSTTGRIHPDRRWFGNTRTIGQNELDKFREEMRTVAQNPYAVVLKRKKVPMGLLSTKDDGNDDDGGVGSSKARRSDLLGAESFEETFSKGKPKKKPRLPAFVAAALMGGGKEALETLAESARARHSAYDEKWDGGTDTRSQSYEDGDHWSTREEVRTDVLRKGQSRRIWSELYKVLDCSDVVLHVLDARDPEGTMCGRVVEQLKTRQSHKHLIFLLNKCDLVPNSVLKKWLKILGATAPTLAFRASISKSYGKGALINVLRQYASLHRESQQISVGIVGFPNVGKSSIINALKAKAVCKAAPIPGETKIWQYVALTRRINLIDSPGVVYMDPKKTALPGEADDVDTVLRGVARAEKLPDPEAYCTPILRRANPDHISKHYGVPFNPPDDHALSSSTSSLTVFEAYCEDYAKKLAVKMGRLLPGGEPDMRNIAIGMINAWVRGQIPHFVPPPGWGRDKNFDGEVEAAPVDEEEEEDDVDMEDEEEEVDDEEEEEAVEEEKAEEVVAEEKVEEEVKAEEPAPLRKAQKPAAETRKKMKSKLKSMRKVKRRGA